MRFAPPLEDLQALYDVMETGLLWHVLVALTRLKIFDAMAAPDVTVAELAARSGTSEDFLFRVLRFVAAHGLIQLEAGVARLTPRGELLCQDQPFSLWATFASPGPADLAHRLPDALHQGQTTAEQVWGSDFWSWLRDHPQAGATFDLQMQQQAVTLSLACVPRLSWPGGTTVADLAGGVGGLLAAVLAQEPTMRGLLVEQDAVLSRAAEQLAARHLADRVSLVAGDLFDNPPAADLYLLARVLHDWDDNAAIRILQAVARSAPAHARLRVFEMLIPEAPTRHRAYMSDVSMLLLFEGGRERTQTELKALLAHWGWTLDSVTASPGPMSVLEARRSS